MHYTAISHEIVKRNKIKTEQKIIKKSKTSSRIYCRHRVFYKRKIETSGKTNISPKILMMEKHYFWQRIKSGLYAGYI